MKRLRFLSLLVTAAATAGIISTMSTCTPGQSGFVPPGHWETVRNIEYYGLPKERLKGDIGPAYALFMVTLAGFHTESFGISIGPDDDVRRTADGGGSWTKSSGTLFCRFGLDIVNGKVAWHCGNGGTRVSVNGGRTWRTVTTSPSPYLSFLDERKGWAASPYELQATSDGGSSWETVPLPRLGGLLAAMTLGTSSDGFLLDAAGNLFATADGGETWELRSRILEADERLIPTVGGPKAALRFTDAKNGMAAFDLSDGTVWFSVTSDGGRTWERSEIAELRGKSLYYHLYLSHDGRLLTATDDFTNGMNASVLLRYAKPRSGRE